MIETLETRLRLARDGKRIEELGSEDEAARAHMEREIARLNSSTICGADHSFSERTSGNGYLERMARSVGATRCNRDSTTGDGPVRIGGIAAYGRHRSRYP